MSTFGDLLAGLDTRQAGQVRRLTAILDDLGGLEVSADPDAVFTSAVRICVPRVCAEATVVLAGEGRELYAFSAPWPGLRSADDPDGGDLSVADPRLITRDAVRIPFEVPAVGEYLAVSGALTLRLRDAAPTAGHLLLGQLIVDRSVAAVQLGRMRRDLASARGRTEQLEAALAGNRTVGVALGILMQRHRLSSEQAFDLLRRVSRYHRRTLADLAVEVTRTGTFVVPREIDLPERAHGSAGWSHDGGPQAQRSGSPRSGSQRSAARVRPFTRCPPRT